MRPREDREIWHPNDDGDCPIAIPYPGYLGALDRSFAAFQAGASPRAADVPRTRARYRSPGRITASLETSPTIWLQFDRPFNARRVLQVGEAVRNAVLSKYDALGLGEPPSELHGHGITIGEHHAQFIPLPNLGNRYAKGQLMGVAIRLPSGSSRRLVGNVGVAAANISRISLRGGSSRSVALRDRDAVQPWTTSSKRWENPATVFVSASPVVHERFGKITSSNQLETVSLWCTNAGLPRPVEAAVSRTPFVEGVPKFSAHDVWRQGSTQGYPFSHVLLRFAEPIRGPVSIGRGRTFGVGLLLPNPDRTPTSPVIDSKDHPQVEQHG